MKYKVKVPKEGKVYTGYYSESGAKRFDLFQVSDTGEWRGFKVILAQQTKKRCFYIGWNGERFSRNADGKILIENYKFVHDEVMAFLKGEI